MDSLLLKQRFINKTNTMLSVVCDGVGSMKDGAFASGTVIRMLNEWYNGVDNIDRLGIKLRDVVLEINKFITSEAARLNMETASTMSALLLVNNDFYIIHIGDSRVYYYTDNELTKLTHDDISESGKLTACIGQSANIFLQYTEGKSDGRMFLLCSDGFYKRLDIQFLMINLHVMNKKSPKHLIETLVKRVIESGEQDNITLALIKTED
jgi:serine/threonine protein phosphatase PrpC